MATLTSTCPTHGTALTFPAGTHVHTLVAPPHPASFAGVVIAVGAENGRVLIRNAEGVERVYTPESLIIDD